jgi:hypothetical protein
MKDTDAIFETERRLADSFPIRKVRLIPCTFSNLGVGTLTGADGCDNHRVRAGEERYELHRSALHSL